MIVAQACHAYMRSTREHVTRSHARVAPHDAVKNMCICDLSESAAPMWSLNVSEGGTPKKETSAILRALRLRSSLEEKEKARQCMYTPRVQRSAFSRTVLTTPQCSSPTPGGVRSGTYTIWLMDSDKEKVNPRVGVGTTKHKLRLRRITRAHMGGNWAQNGQVA